MTEEDGSGGQWADWISVQDQLRQQVVQTDDVPWSLGGGDGENLEWIGGLDISYPKEEVGQCPPIAAIVVLRYPDLLVVYEDYEEVDITVPYRAGFLGFRECPAYQQLLARVKHTQFNPQVLLVDGYGVLHPRQCGSASHLGVISGYPTIGVAKNLLAVDGLTREGVKGMKDHVGEQGQQLGEEDPSARGLGEELPSAPFSPSQGVPTEHDSGDQEGGGAQLLVGTSGRTWGAVLYPHGCRKPLYVSVGHRVGLTTAVEVVQHCCRVRVPEPIRQADLRSRAVLRRGGLVNMGLSRTGGAVHGAP